MEKMNQELDVNNYDMRAIKKMYNDAQGTNIFLNQYTLLDVEESKKKLHLLLLRKYEYKNQSIVNQFIEASSKLLADELFQSSEGTNYNTQMVGVKNIIKDPRKLNQSYFNEIYRIINIDSMYRDNLWTANNVYDSKTSSDMLVYLNDTLDNVVSLEMTNLCIPFTFYNIDSNYGNNYFYIQTVGVDDSLKKIEIASGNYTNASIVDAINDSIVAQGYSDIVFSLNIISNKVSMDTSSTTNTYTIIFYDYLDGQQSFANNMTNEYSADVQSKINNNLGWILGFRTIDKTNICLEYTLSPTTTTITAESLCYIPYTKYFVIVIDDMNKNQTNKGLVQISHDKQRIKPTTYYQHDDLSYNLSCLTEASFNEYCAKDGRKLTKKQLYSALQINNYMASFSNKNSKMDANLINNVFAIVPFENKSLIWGESMFTSDKNKFKRKYNGPVDINKLNIKILDDKGNLLNLNGGEWSLSMVSTHLYQH